MLQLRYQDETGRVTERDVLPPGLFFWGERWLLVARANCAMITAIFRLDRCLEVSATERRFSECADRSLSDFLRKVRCGENKARAAGAAARALSCCISNQKL